MRRIQRVFVKLLRFLFDSTIGVKFNSSIDQDLNEVPKLLKSASTSETIHIVAGYMERGLYSDPSIISAFESALQRKVRLKVICGNELGVKAVPFLELEKKYPQQVEIRRADGYPPSHYLIIGNHHVYIEQHHAPHDSIRRGVVLKNKSSALNMIEQFDRLWALVARRPNKN